jgi:outer membrane protein assembly factor BamB
MEREETMMRKSLPTIAAGLVALMLAGCSAIGSLNPFDKKEEILPGERRAVMTTETAAPAGGSPVIGGASASADWSQPGGNPANAPGHVALAGNGGSVAWRARVAEAAGKRGERPSVPPLIYGGRIFVYDAGGVVSSLTAGGGKQWTVSVAPEGEKGRAIGGGIAASGNALFVASGYGEVVALDAATGGRIWTSKISGPARSAPTAADGKVYVVTSTTVLHALNQSDGTEAWQYPGIPESAGVLSAASPAVSGDTVVVPYSSGEVIAFSTATGELKWADAAIRSTRTLAVSGITDVAASPVISDGIVYASGVGGRTIAVRLGNGERVWEQSIGSASTPVVSGNAVFIIDLQDNLVAMDRATGAIYWKTALPVVRKKKFFSVWSGPTLAGGALWAVSNDGNMVAVDPGSGNIVTTSKLSSPAYIKPVAASGQLLVLSGDGTLTAFQ